MACGGYGADVCIMTAVECAQAVGLILVDCSTSHLTSSFNTTHLFTKSPLVLLYHPTLFKFRFFSLILQLL